MALLVQNPTKASGTHVATATLTSTTAGNTLLAVVQMTSGGTPVLTGASFTQRASKTISFAGNTEYIGIWEANNIAGGITSIVLTEGTPNFLGVILSVFEVSLTGSVSCLDKASAGNNGVSNSATPGSITPTSLVAEFIIAVAYSASGVNTSTAFDSGFSAAAGAGTGVPFTIGYLDTASTSGSYNPARLTLNNYDTWFAVSASFMQPGGGTVVYGNFFPFFR